MKVDSLLAAKGEELCGAEVERGKRTNSKKGKKTPY